MPHEKKKESDLTPKHKTEMNPATPDYNNTVRLPGKLKAAEPHLPKPAKSAEPHAVKPGKSAESRSEKPAKTTEQQREKRTALRYSSLRILTNGNKLRLPGIEILNGQQPPSDHSHHPSHQNP